MLALSYRSSLRLTALLPSDITGLRSESITIVHNSCWLVVDNFSVIGALPCAVVLFKRCTPKSWKHFKTSIQNKALAPSGVSKLLVAWQYANATALFHAAQILFSFTHVGIDLVHALLNAIELFCHGVG